MFAPHYRVYETLKPYAAALDLEKYCDIYEISQMDLRDAEVVSRAPLAESDSADTLQDLKSVLQKLHVVKKMVLCTLLALNAGKAQNDLPRWSAAIETMKELASLTAEVIAHMDEALGEEEGRLHYCRGMFLG